MPILCFDTETCGLPRFDLPSDHPSQPRFVQFGALLCTEAGEELSCVNLLVKPDGWAIDERPIGDDGKPTAFPTHGITNERATQFGIPEATVVAVYLALCRAASIHVSYAGAFDRKIMRISALRSGITREQIEAAEAPPSYCPMKVATPIVNLPPTEKMIAAGFGSKSKPPKLIECVKHFFGEDMVGAHDALADARACFRVYQHLTKAEGATQ